MFPRNNLILKNSVFMYALKDGVFMYALKDGVFTYALKDGVCIYAVKDGVCMYACTHLKFVFVNMTSRDSVFSVWTSGRQHVSMHTCTHTVLLHIQAIIHTHTRTRTHTHTHTLSLRISS